jgi:hypothetical protein
MIDPGPWRPMMPRTIAPSMNSTPSTVVARVRTVAPARAPNAVGFRRPERSPCRRPCPAGCHEEQRGPATWVASK